MEWTTDPELRCSASKAKSGDQCVNKRTENSPYCMMHGGYHLEKAHTENSKRMYHLATHQERVKELAEHNDVITLRSEIGILRLMIEKRMNMFQTDEDLLLNTPVLMDLVGKIEKTVTSCHKLETSLKELLDIQSLTKINDQIFLFVKEALEDILSKEEVGDVMATVSKRIEQIIADERSL